MNYDIILVNIFTRIQAPYLPIIKYMSQDLKIGLLDVGWAPKQVDKLRLTQKQFEDLACDFGAERVALSERHSCSLLMIPQFKYEKGVLSHVFKHIEHKKMIVTNSFGFGLQFMEDFPPKRVHKFLTWDRRLLNKKLLGTVGGASIRNRFDIEVMGSPFQRYPVFPEIDLDYVVAFPSMLGFSSIRERLDFITNVERLLAEVRGRSVALKPHNVKDGGNNIFALSNSPLMGPMYTLCKRLTGISSRVNNTNTIFAFGIAAAHRRVAKKTIPFQQLTKYYNLNLELFLPGVKRGLITGNSASTWYALYNKLPVYNCGKEFETIEGETLRDNMECFGVPPCYGELLFDNRHFDIITEEARGADLIEVLRKEL